MKTTRIIISKLNLVFGLRLIAIAAIFSLSIFGCPTPGSGGGGGGSTVATPTIIPATGTVFQASSQIIMTCATPGAVIHYTLDNSTPTAASPLVYSSSTPIAVSTFAASPPLLHVKAIGILSGSTDSAVTPDYQYTVIDDIKPIPVITSIHSGGVTLPFDITVTFSEPVNGFDPTDPLDLVLTNATVGGVIDANPVFTVTLNPAVLGDVTADINADVCTDTAAAPNQNLAAGQFTIFYDPNALAVTIDQKAAQADPTNAGPIDFTIVFSKPVTDFATGDVTLSGTAGATTAIVTGSGATYNVAVSGMTTDGTVIASLAAGVAHDSLNGPNLLSSSTDDTVTFDTTGPTVTVNQAGAQADPSNSSSLNFEVVFSEATTDFGGSDVTISGTAGPTTAIVSGAGTTYNVAVSGMTGDGTVTAAIAAGVATDAAGNPNAASTATDDTVTYDVTAPTVSINQAAAQADPSNVIPVNFTVIFSESVADFADTDVTLSGTAGATTATVTGSGTTYNVAVSGMTTDGTVTASIAAGRAHDAATNANTASSTTDDTVTFDASALNVTVNQAAAQADPTNGAAIDFTVVFTKPVTDFATGDVTLSGTAGATTAVVTGSLTTYNVAVSGMTSNGTVIASIPAGAAHDAASNANLASSSTDNQVTFDDTAPGVTLSCAAPDPTNSGYTVTVTFSEAINPATFSAADFDFTTGSGTASVPSTSDNITWTSIINPSVQGNITVTINANAVQDLAGNFNTAAPADITRTWDTIAPTVAINQAAAQADPTNGATIDFTVVFSEATADFATGDVNLSGTAGATTATVTGSGTTYNVAVSGMTGDGTVIASIGMGAAHDAAGNANTASTSTDNTVNYDATSPTVTINQAAAQADPTNAGPINFTVVFSEATTDFATGDVTLSGTAGGSKTATVTGSGTTYNVSVTGMTTDGTVIASLNAGVAHDAVGNANTASTSTDNSVAWDATAPGVTVSTTSPDPTTTSPMPFNFAFTETVTGFTASDVTVTGGSAGNLQTSDNRNFTADITVTGAPTANVAVSVNVYGMVCADQAGNGNNAGTPVTVNYNGTSVGFTTGQNATAVFGQPNFTSGAANQGGSVAANTYNLSFGDPVYSNGKLFLPDTYNNRVLVFNSIPATNGNADYVIGQSSLTTATAGCSATSISWPESVSCNGTKLAIVDYTNNRILIYNSIPASSGAAADVVVGQTDFTSNGTGLSATQINGAESVFITSNNKLLIADAVNNRVLIFNSIPTSNGASASLVLGQTDFISGGAGTSATTFHTPTDVWSDGTKLIVSDAYNHRILIWNTFPTSNGQAADVVVGQTDFTSNSNGTAANKFNRQWNFTASSTANQLIVTDLDNNRVLIFNAIPTSNGASADVVLGQPDFTSKNAVCTQSGLNWTCGVAIIDNTRIIVVDANNNRAVIYTGL